MNIKELIKHAIKRTGFRVSNLEIYKEQVRVQNSFWMQYKLFHNTSPVIFDIEAHLGQTALVYSEILPKAYIYSFEPFSESFDIAVKNCQNPNIHLFNSAISNKIGNIQLNINDYSGSNSILPSNNDLRSWSWATNTKESLTVKSDTLDNFTQSNNIEHINILKLDIQGGELLALEGAKRLLQENRIDIIYTEIEFVPFYVNQPLFLDILLYLSGMNYHLYNIYNSVLETNGQLLWCDAIFYGNHFKERINNLAIVNKPLAFETNYGVPIQKIIRNEF